MLCRASVNHMSVRIQLDSVIEWSCKAKTISDLILQHGLPHDTCAMHVHPQLRPSLAQGPLSIVSKKPPHIISSRDAKHQSLHC